MGVAFLWNKGKSIQKQWDAQRKRLSTPTLFAQLSENIRTILVVPMNGYAFGAGDTYYVRINNGRLNIYDAVHLIGICQDPARSVLQAVAEAGGICLAQFHGLRPHIGLVEITLTMETQEDVAVREDSAYEKTSERSSPDPQS